MPHWRDELADLIGLERRTAVVDIGANPIDGDPPYKAMLAAGLCTLVGFEPQPEALARLEEAKGPLETYLPDVIGRGGPARLHVCRYSGMTSLLEPDPARLAVFHEFPVFAAVERVVPVETRRLDDVSAVADLDLLKMDVQGAELQVIDGASRLLGQAVAVQTEVSFVPLYKAQPAIGAVDDVLRRAGFVPHRFAAIKTWPIAPATFDDGASPKTQLLEADLVYVRNFSRPDAMRAGQWRQLAFLAHHVYGSTDLALRCLEALVALGAQGADAPARYRRLVAR